MGKTHNLLMLLDLLVTKDSSYGGLRQCIRLSLGLEK